MSGSEIATGRALPRVIHLVLLLACLLVSTPGLARPRSRAAAAAHPGAALKQKVQAFTSHLGRGLRQGAQRVARSRCGQGVARACKAQWNRPAICKLRRGVKAKARRFQRSALGQFSAGLFIDGPRETWHAIRRNPKTFLMGLGLTGLCAMGGDFLGLPMHKILVGTSGLAAGVEVLQTYKYEFKTAEGRLARARVAGKMTWLPSLVLATALAGGRIGGEHAAAGNGASKIHSFGGAVQSFSSAIVTGGDVPTAAVTAYQTWQDHSDKRSASRAARRARSPSGLRAMIPGF